MFSVVMFVGLLIASAYAVWNGTRQRPGTFDEVRTIAGVLEMIAIVGLTAHIV